MIYKKLNKGQLILAITTSAFIFLFYLIFNINYLTNWIDEKYDSTTYKNHIEKFLNTKEKDFLTKYNMFNPHHLAIDYFGASFYKILKNNGYSGSLMNALQIKNIFVSSLALAIIFFLLYKISKKYILSFLIISLISFSCGFWIYTQINDTPLIHSAILAILFLLSLYYPYAKKKFLYTVFISIFHAINILFHQSDLIFSFVLVFIILFSDKLKVKENNISELKSLIEDRNKNDNYSFLKNTKYLFIYIFTVGLIVSTAYYYIGVVYIGLTLDPSKAETVNKIKGASYFFNWLVLYSRIDYWGRGYEKETISAAIKGVSDYFYQKEGVILSYKLDIFQFTKETILPNLLLIFFISIFLLSIFFLKDVVKKYKFVILSNIIFIIIYTAFACWWEPDYREFWIAPMFSYWMFCFFILNYSIDRFKVIKPIPEVIIYSFAFILSFSLFYYNFLYFIHPNESKNFKSFEIVNLKSDKRAK